jgi:hypothetical protein
MVLHRPIETTRLTRQVELLASGPSSTLNLRLQANVKAGLTRDSCTRDLFSAQNNLGVHSHSVASRHITRGRSGHGRLLALRIRAGASGNWRPILDYGVVIETLSKVAVAGAVVLPLVTARPTYTL